MRAVQCFLVNTLGTSVGLMGFFLLGSLIATEGARFSLLGIVFFTMTPSLVSGTMLSLLDAMTWQRSLPSFVVAGVSIVTQAILFAVIFSYKTDQGSVNLFFLVATAFGLCGCTGALVARRFFLYRR